MFQFGKSIYSYKIVRNFDSVNWKNPQELKYNNLNIPNLFIGPDGINELPNMNEVILTLTNCNYRNVKSFKNENKFNLNEYITSRDNFKDHLMTLTKIYRVSRIKFSYFKALSL